MVVVNCQLALIIQYNRVLSVFTGEEMACLLVCHSFVRSSVITQYTFVFSIAIAHTGYIFRKDMQISTYALVINKKLMFVGLVFCEP